jgi:uncharacterized protein (DUF2126 family)
MWGFSQMWNRAARQPRRNFVVVNGGRSVLAEQHLCASVSQERSIAERLLRRAADGVGTSPAELQCFILNESDRFIEAVRLPAPEISLSAQESPVAMASAANERVLLHA